MMLTSFAQALRYGRTIVAPYARRVKPKFTEKTFAKDADRFSNKLADLFVKFVYKKHKRGQYDFITIAHLTGSEVVEERYFLKGVIRKGKKVSVRDGIAATGITYPELYYIIEHGRRDLGLMPQPFLSKAYRDFLPLYKRYVKMFLQGKKIVTS